MAASRGRFSGLGKDHAYILCLDEGVLHKILKSLSVHDLLAAQCTCRQLNEVIANDRDLWRHMLIPHTLASRLTDARLIMLLKRASGDLQVLEVRGSAKLTGSFLLSDPMKMSTKLEKLWLLECPNLAGSALVNLVGHILQACSDSGFAPRLQSVRLAGSTSIHGKHVRLLQRLLLPCKLDITACPNCPMAGRSKVCHMVTLLETLHGGIHAQAIVLGGEIGCECCLRPCQFCNEFFCSAHLYSLQCGVKDICVRCCGAHICHLCRTSC